MNYIRGILISREEIDELFKVYHKGRRSDVCLLADKEIIVAANKAREQLILSQIGTAHMMIGRFFAPVFSYDEKFAIALSALIYAVDKFDPSKGWALTTYASKTITRNLIVAVQNEGTIRVPRNRNGDERREFLKSVRRYPQENLSKILDTRELDAVNWSDHLALIDEALKICGERQRYVLIHRCKGYTTIDIANQLNITRQRVEQIEKKALRLVRTQVRKLLGEQDDGKEISIAKASRKT